MTFGCQRARDRLIINTQGQLCMHSWALSSFHLSNFLSMSDIATGFGESQHCMIYSACLRENYGWQALAFCAFLRRID